MSRVREPTKKSGPRPTALRHREAPEVSKLIEAHPIAIEWAFTTILTSVKIRGFQRKTHSEFLQLLSK